MTAFSLPLARMRRTFFAALIGWLSFAGLLLGASNAFALTATTLVGSPTANPAVIGQNTTIKATVSPAAASGIVTFKEGTATLGTGTLSAGVATLVTSFPYNGVHTLTAVYSGDATYSGSTSATFNQNVSAITGIWGRIAVEGGSFTVGTNQVVRYGAGTTWFQKVVSGTGTCSTAFIGYDPAVGTVKECMVVASTATSVGVASSVNPSAISQSTNLVATMTPAVTSGTVTFKDGATVLGTAEAASGVASLSSSFSTAGTHSVTAVYAGTATYATSTSAALTQTVGATKATSTTALASSINPSVIAQNTTLTATVTGATPTGTVTFLDGAAALGTGTISGGVATLTTSFSAAGAHSLTATYAGDTGNNASTSTALSQTVNATKATSTTVGTPTANPAIIGQNTTLKATVAPATATGIVTFKEGTATLGTGTLSAGVATLVTSFSYTGVHTLTAVYAGDAGNNTSTSAAFYQNVAGITGNWGRIAVEAATFTVGANQVVRYGAGTTWFQKIVTGAGTCSNAFFGLDPIPNTVKECMVIAGTVTSVALTSSVNPSVVAQSSSLVATMTPAVTNGTVTFKDGATVLGTAEAASGIATLPKSFSTTGTHSLTAVYAGTPTYATSTSAALTHTVTATPATLPAPPSSPTPLLNFEYDAVGNLTKTVQAKGVAGFGFTTQNTYDALSRPKNTTDAQAGITQFVFNGLDAVTQVTDPRNLITQYTRNGLNDTTSVSSPDTGTAGQTYDAAGNLLTRVDSRGVLATYTYDALDRPTSVVYSQAGQTSQSFVWTYDETSAGFTNGIGRLTSITHPAGTSRYLYDQQGRITQERQTLLQNATANPQAIVQYTSYEYDAAGNLTGLLYPSGRKLTLTYTGGLPTGMGLSRDPISAPAALISDLKYAPFGAPQSWTWAMAAGPLPHVRTTDTNGRLIRYPLGEYLRDVSYDAAGRITGYTHYLAANNTSVPARNQQFGYDKLDRLTQATTAQTTWAYTYDANGNRTSVAINNGTPSPYTIASTSNRLTAITTPAITLGYDNAGNTTSDGNFTLAYDLRGRLASSANANGTTIYTYDNLGQRLRKSGGSAGSTVVFAYDPDGHLLGEYDSAGTAIREYVWLEDMPVAVFMPDPLFGANAGSNPPLVYYIHSDHLNTPRVVVDRSNAVRWRWMAEPFGTTAAETTPAGLASLTMNLRFPGQFFDDESGIHYNLQRDYVPGIGRYAQSDPIGLSGGLNTYSYVDSNPIIYFDPEGYAKKPSQETPPPITPLPSAGGGRALPSGKITPLPFPPPFTKPSAAQCPPEYDRIVKDPPFNPHGQKVFTNGKNFITPDVDRHNGGTWKMFDRNGNRIGTYDADMNRIGK